VLLLLLLLLPLLSLLSFVSVRLLATQRATWPVGQ